MRTLRLTLGAAALAAAVACDVRTDPMLTGLPDGGGSGSSTFNVTPNQVALNTGQSVRLTLNSTRAIGPYIWSTNLPGVASVSGDGLVTAVNTGVATITVTSSVDRTVSASTTITVRTATGDGSSGGGSTGTGTGTSP